MSPATRRFCCDEELHREVHAARARGPGWAGRAGRARRSPGRTASKSCRSCSPRTSSPAATPGGTRTPSARICVDARVEDALLHLEVGDAVAEKAADAIVALEDHHVVARRARAAARPRARPGPEPTTATRLPVRGRWRARGASGSARSAWSAIVRSIVLMVTGSSRMVEHARGLARRRAHPAGDLGEVVRREQARRRLVVLAPVDEVVPLGDEVPERDSPGGRRGCRSPCSATPALRTCLVAGRLDDLAPVVHALVDRALVLLFARDLQKALRITHVRRHLRRRPAASAPGARAATREA